MSDHLSGSGSFTSDGSNDVVIWDTYAKQFSPKQAATHTPAPSLDNKDVAQNLDELNNPPRPVATDSPVATPTKLPAATATPKATTTATPKKPKATKTATPTATPAIIETVTPVPIATVPPANKVSQPTNPNNVGAMLDANSQAAVFALLLFLWLFAWARIKIDNTVYAFGTALEIAGIFLLVFMLFTIANRL